MTIKGLEPEIQKIISGQKEEKKRMELRFKEEMKQRLEECEIEKGM